MTSVDKGVFTVVGDCCVEELPVCNSEDNATSVEVGVLTFVNVCVVGFSVCMVDDGVTSVDI